MATYERRRNSSGEIIAIRVKIRRVGSPHISRTFLVEGRTNASIERTERSARLWAKAMEKELEKIPGSDTPAPPSQVHGMQAKGSLSTAWLSAVRAGSPGVTHQSVHSTGQQAAGPLQLEPAFENAATPLDKALVAFCMDSDLSLDEISRLRWQHLQLANYTAFVSNEGGMISRTSTLTKRIVSTLLSINARKYGPIFGMSSAELARRLDSVCANPSAVSSGPPSADKEAAASGRKRQNAPKL